MLILPIIEVSSFFNVHINGGGDGLVETRNKFYSQC